MMGITSNTVVWSINEKSKKFPRYCEYANKINELFHNDTSLFPAFEFKYDVQKRLFGMSYTFLSTPEPRLLKFGMFYLDVDGGWVTMNDSNEPIILGNFYIYMDKVALGNDLNEFKNRLEMYYLGKLTYEQIFEDLPALGYKAVSDDSEIRDKSNLFKMIYYSYAKDSQAKEGAKTFNLDDWWNFVDRIAYLQLHIKPFLRNLSRNSQDSYFEHVQDTKGHFYSADIYPDDPNLWIKASNTVKKGGTSEEYASQVMHIPGVDGVASKSEKNFMRLLPLLKISQDDEARVMNALLGEKQEIIDTIKSSVLAPVVKGAFLKGVITKAENLIEATTNTYRTMNKRVMSINFDRANLIKRWSYALQFFNKILKIRM